MCQRLAITPARGNRGSAPCQSFFPDAVLHPRDRSQSSRRWAQRLKRAFGIDVENCVRCGKAVRVAAPAPPSARGISASLHVIASIEEPALIERILAHVRGKAGSDTAARGRPSASA